MLNEKEKELVICIYDIDLKFQNILISKYLASSILPSKYYLYNKKDLFALIIVFENLTNRNEFRRDVFSKIEVKNLIYLKSELHAINFLTKNGYVLKFKE